MVVNLFGCHPSIKRELSKSYLSLVPPTPFCVRPSPVGLMGPDPDLRAPQLAQTCPVWAGGTSFYVWWSLTGFTRLVGNTQWTVDVGTYY